MDGLEWTKADATSVRHLQVHSMSGGAALGSRGSDGGFPTSRGSHYRDVTTSDVALSRNVFCFSFEQIAKSSQLVALICFSAQPGALSFLTDARHTLPLLFHDNTDFADLFIF